MALHFLDFDYSEDEGGIATWDAMASATAPRLPALLDEVASILAWAQAAFGEPAPHEEGGLWQYDLQCERDGQSLAGLAFDMQAARVALPAGLRPGERVTVNLSLSAQGALAEAFADHLGQPG